MAMMYVPEGGFSKGVITSSRAKVKRDEPSKEECSYLPLDVDALEHRGTSVLKYG
jgi:hypothetical protein